MHLIYVYFRLSQKRNQISRSAETSALNREPRQEYNIKWIIQPEEFIIQESEAASYQKPSTNPYLNYGSSSHSPSEEFVQRIVIPDYNQNYYPESYTAHSTNQFDQQYQVSSQKQNFYTHDFESPNLNQDGDILNYERKRYPQVQSSPDSTQNYRVYSQQEVYNLGVPYVPKAKAPTSQDRKNLLKHAYSVFDKYKNRPSEKSPVNIAFTTSPIQNSYKAPANLHS